MAAVERLSECRGRGRGVAFLERAPGPHLVLRKTRARAAQAKRGAPKIMEGKDLRNRWPRQSSLLCRSGELFDVCFAGGLLGHPADQLLECLVEQEERREGIEGHDERDY